MKLSCPTCTKEDDRMKETPAHSQSHLSTECEALSDLREEFDLGTDSRIIEFYREAMKRLVEEKE